MSRVLGEWAARAARVPLWAAFLAVALPTLLMLVFLVPLGQVADEPAHMIRAAGLADGRLIGHRGPALQPDGSRRVVAGMEADPAVLRVMIAALSGDTDVVRWTGQRSFQELGTIGTYTPTFYAPAALAFGVAKAASASPAGAALAARVANGLLFLAIGVAALRLAVQGQAILFAFLAVPMSLSLGASVNHDGLIVATSVLAVACMTRVILADAEGRPSGAFFATAALCLALVVAAKPPYLPMAAILLLPLGRAGEGIDWRRTGVRAGIALLVVLPALVWTAYGLLEVSAPFYRAPYEAGPLWTGERPATFDRTDPGAQLRVLLTSPVRLVTIPAEFLLSIRHLWGLAVAVIGVLGWLDVKLPVWLYMAWAAALAGTLWPLVRPFGPRDMPAAVAAPGLQIALLGVAMVGSVWGVLLSQYLTWTNVGLATIDGPQGRYFLLVLPLLALLPARDGRLVAPSDLRVAWAPALLALIGLPVLSWVMTARYAVG